MRIRVDVLIDRKPLCFRLVFRNNEQSSEELGDFLRSSKNGIGKTVDNFGKLKSERSRYRRTPNFVRTVKSDRFLRVLNTI